jgi:molecular chaperone HscB
MNYFELFEIPVSFKIDKALVKKKFYELSRKFHPDFFTDVTTTQKEAILEQSSLINKAYKVFSNEDETIQYVLQLKKLLVEDEKFELPENFLMEMMELNEAITDAKIDENEVLLAELKKTILNVEKELYEVVEPIVENYQEDSTTQEAMLQVKKYYFQKKYLSRIKDLLEK